MESYTQHIIHTLANTLPYIHTKRIERMVRKTKARYASTWRVYTASQHPRSGRIFSHDLAPSAYSATYNADKHTQHTLSHCKYIYIHIYTINVHLVSATIWRKSGGKPPRFLQQICVLYHILFTLYICVYIFKITAKSKHNHTGQPESKSKEAHTAYWWIENMLFLHSFMLMVHWSSIFHYTYNTL